MPDLTALGAVVDLETTGLNPNIDEIIEICIILFRYNHSTGEVLEIIDEYHSFNEPSVPISKNAARKNKITLDMVRGHRLDPNRITDMLNQSRIIIAHNARFDKSFLVKICPAADRWWKCSMNGIDWYYKGLKSKSLDAILAYHYIERNQSHRASDDAKALLTLLSTTSSDGYTFLYELLHERKILEKRYAITKTKTHRETAAAGGKQTEELGCGCATFILSISTIIAVIIIYLLFFRIW